jgi:DHA1 family multidrug resistance protein-like MFS transporter
LVGLFTATVLFSQAVLNGPMGVLADRIGHRRMVVLGPILSLIAAVATLAVGKESGAAAIVTMFVLRILDGVAAAMLWPALYAIIGDRVQSDQQSGAMGILNATYMIGLALGPFVGGLLNDLLGARYSDTDPHRYAPSLLAAGAFFAIAAVIAYFVAPRREQEKHAHDTTTDAAHGHGSAASVQDILLALKRVPMLLGLSFLIFLAVGLMGPNVKLYSQAEMGMSETKFGAFLLVPALFLAVAAVPVGRLGDKWGKARSVQIGLALCALSLGALVLIPHEVALIILGTLIGIGYVLAFPSYLAYISETAGAGARASLTGAALAAQGVGMGVGSVIASPLFKQSHKLPFTVAAILLAVCVVLSFPALRAKPTEAFGDEPDD